MPGRGMEREKDRAASAEEGGAAAAEAAEALSWQSSSRSRSRRRGGWGKVIEASEKRKVEGGGLFAERAAQAGDVVALAEVEELCRVLGRMLYNLVITLDLQAICLGGSVFWHHRDFLLPRLAAQIQGRLPALTDGVLLLPAGLQDQVGDYAALALVA